MTEDFDQWEDQEIRDLIERFEGMLGLKDHYFFDSEDFEEIIDFYLERDNPGKAEAAINLALTQFPLQPAFLIRKAQLMEYTDKTEEALNILENAEKLDPTNLDILLTRAGIFSRQRQPEKAIEVFKKILPRAENAEEIHSLIAFEYQNLGNYHKALDHLKLSIELNPTNENALYEISFCYEVTHQLDKGIRFFEQFIDRDPYSRTAWFCLGVLCNTNGLFEKAIEAYDFVIAIDETFSSAYFNKANSFANLGLYAKAIECYRETLNYEEPEAMVLFYIGECYEELEAYQDALDNYLAAIEIDDKFSDAFLAAGNVYDLLDQRKEALEFMKTANELEPNNPTYLFHYADLLYEYGEHSQGIEMLEKALSIDPYDEEIYELLGWMYANNNLMAEAIRVLNDAVLYLPDNTVLPYHLAACLWMKGNVAEAYSQVHQALDKDFSKHQYLFDYFPELKQNTSLLAIIEEHRK